MDHSYSTTNEHKKGQHLTYDERMLIQIRLKDGKLDACAGHALRDGVFTREQTVCMKTLHNYVDLGLLKIKNINLPVKPRRNTKLHRNRSNKKKLGRSIEERPAELNERQEFGQGLIPLQRNRSQMLKLGATVFHVRF